MAGLSALDTLTQFGLIFRIQVLHNDNGDYDDDDDGGGDDDDNGDDDDDGGVDDNDDDDENC